MSFWTGLLAGATGHQRGAFKGFNLKDILDEDMWEMRERKFPNPRYAEEGLPAPTTAWYKGMGKPELMGPVVGGAREEIGSRNRPDVPRPSFSSPIMPEGAENALRGTYATTKALPPKQPTKEWPTFANPYQRSASSMLNPATIGRQKVPSLYDPYLFKLRQDQMGAEQFNPLNRRMQQSKRDQQGLTTAGQYRKGIQDAVGTLGDAFLPADVMEGGREMWGDLRDFYYPGKDAPLFPADKKTVTKRSANPTEADTETITITEKILGPSGHRMGAFKDTAADVWKNIREDDIIKYWMNQFRGN